MTVSQLYRASRYAIVRHDQGKPVIQSAGVRTLQNLAAGLRIIARTHGLNTNIASPQDYEDKLREAFKHLARSGERYAQTTVYTYTSCSRCIQQLLTLKVPAAWKLDVKIDHPSARPRRRRTRSSAMPNSSPPLARRDPLTQTGPLHASVGTNGQAPNLALSLRNGESVVCLTGLPASMSHDEAQMVLDMIEYVIRSRAEEATSK